MSRQDFDDQSLLVLSGLANLDLPAERRQLLAPALNGVVQQFEAFERIDVGEMPPVHSFNPLWEKSRE